MSEVDEPAPEVAVREAAVIGVDESAELSKVLGQTTSSFAASKSASGLVVLNSVTGVIEPANVAAVAAAEAKAAAAAAVEVLGVDVMLRSAPASMMLMEDTLLSALIRLPAVGWTETAIL